MTDRTTKGKGHKSSNINMNKKNKAIKNDSDLEKKYHLIIIFVVICVLPLIVRLVEYDTGLASFAWFPSNGLYYDLFLFYKHKIFLIVTGVIAIYIAIKLYSDRQLLKRSYIFIPLAIYALLVILSTAFSEYSSFSLKGSFEQFESVFALLGYCLVAYYSYIILSSERDFRYVYYFILTLSLIFSILGVFQFLGHDFFNSEIGEKLVIPIEYRDMGLDPNFEKGRVYLSLYNPNYVGFLCSLFLPILFVMTLFEKKVITGILSILSFIGLSICLIGSKSLTGLVGLVFAMLAIIIFLFRYIIKHWIITLTVITVLIVGILIAGKVTDNLLLNRLKEAINITKSQPNLSSIKTENDEVSITYLGNTLNIKYIYTDDSIEILVYDDTMTPITNSFDPNRMVYILEDNRFNGIEIGFDKLAGGFYAIIEDWYWRFLYSVEDNSYYFINRYNKIDKIYNAPAALFNGYERIASGRGYIWSRTIPLLKKYFLLGSGPDTFTMTYPQNDYVGMYNYGYGEQILTKPHNMYLQIGVQTGVLSLLAFLTFYLLYFISSVKLYIKGRFTNIYLKMGLAILVGTLSYMVAGLSYDSTITFTPIFWTLLGAGLAANYKAKQIINQNGNDDKKDTKNLSSKIK